MEYSTDEQRAQAIRVIAHEAARIGYGVIMLPKTDVKGMIVLMEGETLEEGFYIQVIRNAIQESTENAFDQALTDFGQAYVRYASADNAGADVKALEAPLIRAEEKVKAEAVRYARREGKSHE